MQRNSGNGTYAGGYKFAELEHMLGGPYTCLEGADRKSITFFTGNM